MTCPRETDVVFLDFYKCRTTGVADESIAQIEDLLQSNSGPTEVAFKGKTLGFYLGSPAPEHIATSTQSDV